MSETPRDTRMRRSQPKTQAEVKLERLQAALRDNLRRRKAVVPPTEGENTNDHEKASPNDS